MNSLEASRRSFRNDGDYNHQRSTLDRRESHLNTPLIMSSATKQRPRANSSGVRSPTEAGRRAHSLVPPLPIHMINNNQNRDHGQQVNHKAKKSSAAANPNQ